MKLARYLSRPQPLRLLLSLLVAAGLLPLALLGIWGIHAVYEREQRDIERATVDISRALASAVDAEIASTVAALETLSYHPALAGGRYDEFYAVSKTAARARPYWRSVVLSDSAGRVIFRSSLPYGETTSAPSDPESLLQVMRERRPLVGSLREGQLKSLALPVRVPVIVGGEVKYVVTAALMPNRIDDLLVRQNVPQGWAISVADSSFQRVSRSHERDQFVGKRFKSYLQDIIRGAALDGNGVLHNAEGVPSIAGFTKVPRWNLSVVVSAPTSVLHQAFAKALAIYAVGIVLSLLVCVIIAREIARKIIGGINQLQAQASTFGRGRAVVATACGIIEIERLAHFLDEASAERLAFEGQREVLVENLNRSLRSVGAAMDKAREAALAKDHFMAVLGHELRNPLAPIVSTLDLMDLRGGDVYLRERKILRRQVSHVRRLVDDLLDVSRIAQGKLRMNKHPVLLNAVVARAHESILAAVPGRVAPLTIELPTEEAWTDGDEDRLLQLFTNVLNNAVRHAPDAPISLRLSLSEATATITVSDAGSGMTAEMLSKVFTAFYQAPQPIARAAGGLGLGLTIARSVVHMHGGNITASSQGLGHGSEFRIDLPSGMLGVAPVSEPSQFGLPQSFTPARILVVDDNIDAATTIAESLAALGHDVRVAHTAMAGLALVSAFKPDIAILDIGLPDVDGLELARRIRSSSYSSNLLLIALTGYSQDNDRHLALEAGFDEHMAKPVSIATLSVQIENLRELERRSVYVPTFNP